MARSAWDAMTQGRVRGWTQPGLDQLGTKAPGENKRKVAVKKVDRFDLNKSDAELAAEFQKAMTKGYRR